MRISLRNGFRGSERQLLPVVGVQNRHLILSRFDHVRVTVTDVTDIVDAVQELVAHLIVHVLT